MCSDSVTASCSAAALAIISFCSAKPENSLTATFNGPSDNDTCNDNGINNDDSDDDSDNDRDDDNNSDHNNDNTNRFNCY